MSRGRRPTTPRRHRVALVASLGALLAAVLATGGPAVLAADEAVAISGFAYAPGTVTVAVGDAVTWTNSDAQAHTATADDDSWDTGTLTNGASGSVTFQTVGTFDYHCDIHPEMTGTVIVEAADTGGGPTVTSPPTDTAASLHSRSEAVGSPWALLVAGIGLAAGALVGLRRGRTS